MDALEPIASALGSPVVPRGPGMQQHHYAHLHANGSAEAKARLEKVLESVDSGITRLGQSHSSTIIVTLRGYCDAESSAFPRLAYTPTRIADSGEPGREGFRVEWQIAS